MAYFTLHAYDADVNLQAFLGLTRVPTEMNGDIRYAEEAVNVETPNGVLQPQAAPSLMEGEFTDRIETLAMFHRRWYAGNGSKDWLIAVTGGKLYQRQVGEHVGWMEIDLPSGIDAYQCSVWSWVTYEMQPDDDDSSPIDVLLMSNKQDGMIVVIPPDRPRNWNDLTEQTWNAVKEETWKEVTSPRWAINSVDTQGYKFGVIARYAERIWGGDVEDEPDLLVYSAPYDPTDWEANTDIPEDGAGEVRQPSWDGDSFTALRAFGDQLIAFKERKVWRVMGTDPGEFTFKEQFGGGAPYFNTVVVDVERILMAEREGMSSYDGMSVAPFARDAVKRIWQTINPAAMNQMCAVLYDRKYYLAFPTGDSEVNNALLVYDLQSGSILYYEDIYIESMLATETELYATSSSLPGKVVYLHYDSWKTGAASGKATRWVTPWMDFGYKRIVKGGFEVYFTPEVQNEAVTLKFSIQSEKKLKTKYYTVQPLTEEQRAADKHHRYKRLHFGGSGRRFRLIIETDEGETAPWRLIGGIQMVAETDPD